MEIVKIDNSEYIMLYDYHTHTVYSHGKGTIEENVKAGIEAGLKAIAISDHGPGHLTYGIKRGKVPEMRQEINRLKEIYKDIEIFLSVEANISAQGNYLDILPDEIPDYDFIMAGYHYGIKNGFCVKNFVSSNLPGDLFKKSLLVKNTDMVVKALYQNPIKVLTHPGDKGPFDLKEIAKACAQTGALMEISTWHSHLTVEEIKICASEDVRFIISSDAHSPQRIGSFGAGIKRAREAGLDIGRIANIQRVSATK